MKQHNRPAPTIQAIGLQRQIVLAIGCGLIGTLLWLVSPYLITLFLAAITAVMVFPVYAWIETRSRGRRNIAASLTILFVLALLVVPIAFVIVQFADEAQTLLARFLPLLEAFPSKLRNGDLGLENRFLTDMLVGISDALVQAMNEFSNRAGALIFESAASVTMGVADAIIQMTVFIFALAFALREGPQLVERFEAYFEVYTGVHAQVLQRIYSVSRAAIRGTLLIGLVQGLLTAIGLYFAGFGDAVFWGVVAAIISMIPVVGTPLVWGPAVLYLLFNGEPPTGILLGVWGFGVIAQSDNILRPILVGSDAELPDFVVLVSTLGGISLFGPAGIILGPVVAAIALAAFDIIKTVVSVDTQETNARIQSQVVTGESRAKPIGGYPRVAQ